MPLARGGVRGERTWGMRGECAGVYRRCAGACGVSERVFIVCQFEYSLTFNFYAAQLFN